jgi:hypothetical protein
LFSMDDAEKIISKLEEVKQAYGYYGVAIAIILIVALILIWKYIARGIEKAAEVNSELSLKKFQVHLDKELVTFSTKHQKQIDAVHECYTKLQKLTYMIDFIMHPDKFYNAPKPKEELQYVINFRHEFKEVYRENRIVLPLSVCNHIDKLIPAVDEFIEIFEKGLWDLRDEEIALNSEQNDGVYIAGIWSNDAFDKVLSELKEVGQEIEKEFRIIYGTEK